MRRRSEDRAPALCGSAAHTASGDLLVLNDTRVVRARLPGRLLPGSGRAEILLLRPVDKDAYDAEARQWLVLGKPARKLRAGASVAFADGSRATVCEERDSGTRVVRLDLRQPFESFIEDCGLAPLPPYVRRPNARAIAGYQTVFAREPGSVAAPTASLHFTEETFRELKARDVQTAFVTLNVGLGTFRPITATVLGEHRMHGERYAIPAASAAAIEDARASGRRIVAAGTTTLRALESCALRHGKIRAIEEETELFVRPGFRFRVVDLLLTNFHLPRSTLLVLVHAFGGSERMRRVYRSAVAQRYRFYSFGDAMLIERRSVNEL